MRVEQLRAQNLLAMSQVALALVLSVASGLLIRSFLAMRAVHPGFHRPRAHPNRATFHSRNTNAGTRAGRPDAI